MCRFYFDRDGTPLTDVRELTAQDVGGSAFTLETLIHQNSPAVAINRTWPADLTKDPYNSSGSPPSVWSIIVHPYFEFTDRGVVVKGLEKPNMMWAGLARKVYGDCTPLTLPPERIWDPDIDEAPTFLNRLRRQEIYLSVADFPRYTPKLAKTG